MTAIRKIQGLCFYIYKKQKKRETFYIQKSINFGKARQYLLRIYMKSKTLYVTQFFMKILYLAFISKNHDNLRYVTLLYTNPYT